MAAKEKGDKSAPTTSSRDEVRASASDVSKAINAVRSAEARLTANRAKADAVRANFDQDERAKAAIATKEARLKEVVLVVIQTRKDKDLRMREGVIKIKTPTMVSRRMLRVLQGMSRNRKVQLVVGELNKPGKIELWVKGSRSRPSEAKKKG